MKKTKKLFVIFSYISVVTMIFFFGCLLLLFPQQAACGVEKGINLCLYTLMPSMYPFMFLSSFVISSSVADRIGSVFSLFTRKIFKLPGICGVIIMLSMVGGLPVGAKAVEDACSMGYISKTEGQRLLTFCINPGPAFVITSVGFYFLGSKTAGIVIYASLVLSSLIIGFLTRFVFQECLNNVCSKEKVKTDEQISFSASFVSSVNTAISSVINVSAWVILFSCVSELISLLPVSERTALFITGITEMTNGVRQASGKVPMPVIAGIIGFTGICGQMQIMPTVIKLKMKLKYFLTARIINSALAMVISMFLFDALHISVETVTLGRIPTKIASDFSFPVCIGVLVLSVLLLLGDNFNIKKDKKTTHRKTL